MFKSLVKTLGLTIIKHPHLYKLDWIKKGIKLIMNEIYQVPFPIGKFFQDEVTYNMLKMSTCHLPLERP